jgi:hypothetical protein
MEQSIVREPNIEHDRVHAAEMLAVAERNPVLSDKQACGVAQVYALLAVEQRLAQLCATLERAVVALAESARSADPSLVS